MWYTFREKRTGKLKTIGGARSAEATLKALTIYPWAFRLVDVRPLSVSPPSLTAKDSELKILTTQ